LLELISVSAQTAHRTVPASRARFVVQIYFTSATLGSLALVAYASLHCERGTAFSTAILTSTHRVLVSVYLEQFKVLLLFFDCCSGHGLLAVVVVRLSRAAVARHVARLPNKL
jgi:hypothetical protein